MNDIKYRDAVKILKKNGYIHQYQTGDHHIFLTQRDEKSHFRFIRTETMNALDSFL